MLLSTKRTATFETVKRMEKNGLLIQGQVDDKRVWGLTPAGAFLADEDGKCRHFDPKRISAITLKHDLAVQRAKVEAMTMGWSDFLAERTLRQMAVKERTTWLQVPDALAVSPRGRKVAFEVERTAKTPKRYKAIFDSYCQMLADRTIQEVVYICSEDICPRLERLFLKIETMTVDGKIHSFSDSFRKRFHFVTCDGWEDYAKELHRISQADPTTENVAMADIADHNSGEIVEVEHHDKPITLSIAVNKNIGKRWSLETGLQYSYLKSYLILGTGSYRVDKEQKLHYIGIPVKLSYQFMAYKKLSAYGSAGASIQIPLSGKTYADYVVGGKSGYTTDWKTIPSIQWTVNTNIGIQYQFAPKLTLFVEPTLNWYIPNGSEVKNTWTERPFTLTVPFGIRLSW